MAVGRPTVRLIALGPPFSPIMIKELFKVYAFLEGSAGCMRKICCIARRSVSPGFSFNFLSNSATRFSRLDSVGLAIWN